MASIVDGEDRLLTLKDVMAITQLSKPSLVQANPGREFPKATEDWAQVFALASLGH